MSDDTDSTAEDLKRVPGLFRRWELTQVLDTDRRYRLEDAGTHADGTPLLAVYANDAVGSLPVETAGRSDRRGQNEALLSGTVAEQFIGQRELAVRWSLSPRTLERWRRLKRGPSYLKLGVRIVYDLRHIRQFETAHLNGIWLSGRGKP